MTFPGDFEILNPQSFYFNIESNVLQYLIFTVRYGTSNRHITLRQTDICLARPHGSNHLMN